MRKPSVVVHAPDSRGLRTVTVNGAPVGSAWSLGDLRKQLRRAGLPDTRLDDCDSITWRDGGSDTWPDRPWRRRVVIALMVVGLFASMVLLIDVGRVDALGALTFAGRVTGFLLVFAGAAQGLAAAAAFEYWGKRTLTYSGALVLVGVLIALATEGIFLILWLQEREYTPYVPAFFMISIWALWALWVLWRQQPWKEIPHPKGFTVGVAATAALATANFAYSVVYQPSAAILTFSIDVTFGKPVPDSVRPVIHLPVEVNIKNTGTVPAYVIAAGYRVAGRISKFEKDRKQFDQKEWRKAAEWNIDTELHVEPTGYQSLNVGGSITPGLRLNPGDRSGSKAVVQIPKDAKYDLIAATAGILLLRADRAKIDSEFSVPIYSWAEKKNRFFECSSNTCPDYVMHHGRLHYSNNLINVTRRPRYISSVRVLSETGGESEIAVNPYNTKGNLLSNKESLDRFGVSGEIVGATAIPFAALLPARH
ncbi:hypothetical protein SAMN05216489_03999 [Streptomyces sp. 3213]|uniref:hypothetical protein n=1 Tax=Streptomyces sp. 3213.3 TaxID=1855348 RepID=UPI000897EBAC|nr:hypothetical protein [Streptomyces sp. 3213.3]SED64391.1 hypothetical protein SAMN05216489_03999 [Streptomyces sp. 3213] [Streptomyces sp. 3213.3]